MGTEAAHRQLCGKTRCDGADAVVATRTPPIGTRRRHLRHVARAVGEISIA